MEPFAIAEIKPALQSIPIKQLKELCLQLAKYKVDNKEYLGFLLFESNDIPGFVEKVKMNIDEQFEELPKANWYLTKKSLRKILRGITKYSRYTGPGEPAIEMLMHFCKQLNQSGMPFREQPAFVKIYEQQLKKINTQIASLHEDLQFDYHKQLRQL